MRATLAFILLTSVFVLPAASARAAGELYLFDVIRRPAYRDAYVTMLKGARGLPSWMATPTAASGATATPAEITSIDGKKQELFDICEQHNCSGHHFIVMFQGAGTTATGVLAIEGQTIRFFGMPSLAEQNALKAAIP